MDKIDLLKKLKTLAERGVGGEKVNAAKQLEKLMKKYGITEEQISDDVVEVCWFKCGNDFTWLITQIIFKVTGECGSYYTNKFKRGQRGYELTKAQYIEASFLFDSHLRNYKKELATFKHAYIIANDIFPDGDGVGVSESTKEEREAARKAAALASNMDKLSINKALNH